MEVLKGYKGLSKDMKPVEGNKGYEPYKIGQIYYKENIEKPRLCSKDGYHFCENLLDVGEYYPFSVFENRYFEIDVLGNYTNCPISNKSITTAFRLVRELPREEVDKYVRDAKIVTWTKRMVEMMKLPLVRDLQKLNPNLIIGGSIALFLHGCYLSRWEKGFSDLDLVLPFYQILEGDLGEGKGIEIREEEDEEKYEDNDFEQTLTINGISADLRIDPNQRYEIIELLGVKFKVTTLDSILEAKLRYKNSQNGKHRDDIRELVTNSGRTDVIDVKAVRKLKEINKELTLDTLLTTKNLIDSTELPF